MRGQFDIRQLGPDDLEVLVTSKDLFDYVPRPDQSQNFLASDRDFIWFAFDEETPVGFVSASVILHPDKPPHLFVNELTTHEAHRRRGIATRLVEAVIGFGKSRGLWPVWLAAEADDEPAKAFYRALSQASERDAIVFEWE